MESAFFEEKFSRQLEDFWCDNDTDLGEKILKHNFNGVSLGFGISGSGTNSNLTVFEQFYGAISEPLYFGDMPADAAEKLVEDTVKQFGHKQKVTDTDIINYIYEQANLQQGAGIQHQLETARKAGYVQGVCECVAAIGDDHTLGKKLLTEMNVTKDMAKKYANPETYKQLEQGIFAPKPEQKLEQTQGFKR